ncbi:MAG: hypothetical protein NC324_05630 [Bacteroides sp.]|nr:hypothetical protein [Bacteroides sp.]
MKTIRFFVPAIVPVLLLASCGNSKHYAKPEETRIESARNLEGNKVRVMDEIMDGTEEVKTLSEDGTKMVTVPYRWFAGKATADDRQTAIEMARRDAHNTVSLTLNNVVQSVAEKGGLEVNKRVQEALKTYWKQVSTSVISGCEPYGAVRVEYDPVRRMYEVTARVAIRGDRYVSLVNTAGRNTGNYGLNQEELQEFMEMNEAIMNAAKSAL